LKPKPNKEEEEKSANLPAIVFGRKDSDSRNLLRIASRHRSMMARAPMLSRKICSSCMSSQLLPENPEGQMQV
jgi:hypothetical protein